MKESKKQRKGTLNVSKAKGQVQRGDLTTLATLDAEALGVFCWSDVRPLAGVAAFLDWRLCGALSRTLESVFFEGRCSEVMLLCAKGRTPLSRLFVFGLGKSEEMSEMQLRHVSRQAFDIMRAAGVTKLVFAAPAVRHREDLEEAFVKAVQEELPGRIDILLVEYGA